MKLAKFLRTPILNNICERLPLNVKDIFYLKSAFCNLNRIIYLFPIGWSLFFSTPKIHVINLLVNDTICIYFPCHFTLLHHGVIILNRSDNSLFSIETSAPQQVGGFILKHYFGISNVTTCT